MISKCACCGKIINNACVVKRHNIRKEIEFCSYEHYLKFWAGIPEFVPLTKISSKK